MLLSQSLDPAGVSGVSAFSVWSVVKTTQGSVTASLPGPQEHRPSDGVMSLARLQGYNTIFDTVYSGLQVLTASSALIFKGRVFRARD